MSASGDAQPHRHNNGLHRNAPDLTVGTAVPARAPNYRSERLSDLAHFLSRAQALVGPDTLPLLRPLWMRAWYETLGQAPGSEPVLVAVQRQAADGTWHDAMLLPLVLRQRGRWRELGFADAGVVDYVSPLMAPQWTGQAPADVAARAMWRALKPVLRLAHWWHIDKLLARSMPEDGGWAQPLAMALPLVPSRHFGNQFSVTGDWDSWRSSLPKRVRKEIERSWRVFERSPSARFERITDPARAARLLAVLEEQQAERMRAMGADFVLDNPAYRDFHRRLLTDALGSGEVVLTALTDGDAVVSVLLGVASRSRYIGLRQSIAGGAWAACSPGRLLDEATARELHAAGRTWFDFGIGDYRHKTRLDMDPLPLLSGAVALRPSGWLPVLAWRLRRHVRRQPWAQALWRRWRPAQAAAAARTLP